VLTETGASARLVAKYRPSAPVFVLTPSVSVARQCSGFLKSCEAAVIPADMTHASPEELFASAIDRYRARGLCQVGDAVVCLFGTLMAVSGSTNTIRVVNISV
jgi:pyruvate kinase